MSDILKRIKSQVRIAEATLTGKIVQIPKDVRNFNCPNHWESFKGKQVKKKMIIAFNPRMNEFTCECGTIYKRV